VVQDKDGEQQVVVQQDEEDEGDDDRTSAVAGLRALLGHRLTLLRGVFTSEVPRLFLTN